MKDSHIAWPHHTFNLQIGCKRESEECNRCYAATLDARYGYTKSGWGKTAQQKEQSRRMLPAWSRDIRDQCKKKEIPFFFKQWGNWIPTPEGDQRWFGNTAAFYREKSHLLDGTEHKQFPTSSNKYQLL